MQGVPKKIIYLGPIKTLCAERYLDWKEKFGSVGTIRFKWIHSNHRLGLQSITFLYIGMSCYELTGDSDNHVDYRSLLKHDIIFTTPEKWDSITRKWKEITFFLKEVAMLIIDEVHMLNENRGATLEAVVSRVKMMNNERNLQGSRLIRSI